MTTPAAEEPVWVVAMREKARQETSEVYAIAQEVHRLRQKKEARSKFARQKKYRARRAKEKPLRGGHTVRALQLKGLAALREKHDELMTGVKKV